MMNGQKLVQVVVDQSNGRASFHFDLGGLLETWPVGDDPTEEQWFIYSPEKQAFGYRADGKFSSSALDTARSDERWRSFG